MCIRDRVAGDLLRRTLKALDKVGGGGLFLVIEHGDEESLVLCSEFPIGCREDSVCLLYTSLSDATRMGAEYEPPTITGDRAKLAGRVQDDAVFVFDEPTIGLHPLDVQVLLSVFDGLVAKGATVIVIEHDRCV